MKNYHNVNGFTLVEFLIVLVVIGVVASVTLPLLINKIQDKQFDRAREKALLSIGGAGRLASINGEMSLSDNADDFVKNYLSKYLKIVKYCGTNLTDCGFTDKITKLGTNEKISMPITVAELSESNRYPYASSTLGSAFLTANGYSVNLFYNPSCRIATDYNKYSGNYDVPQRQVCVNAIYDMNGRANPNKVGKDIGFVTVFYPDERVVAVAPNLATEDLLEQMNWMNANKGCVGKYDLPTFEELAASFYNLNLTNLNQTTSYWSSSPILNNKALSVNASTINGLVYINSVTSYFNVRCVKRK